MSLPPNDWSLAQEVLAEAGADLPVPWEDETRPSVPALFLTVGQILLHPKRFFARLALSGGLGDPLGFALLVGTGGVLGLLWWTTVWQGSILSALPTDIAASHLGNLAPEPLLIVGIILLVPLYVVGSQFLTSGVLWLPLRWLGPADVTYEAVFRLVAYSQAAMVLGLLPWLGGLLAQVWQPVLIIIGLSQTLGLSWGRGLLALMLAGLLVALGFLLLLMGLVALGLWRLLGG
jgi:hypothetical protein